MTTRIALQLNAIVGLASALAAGALISLLLTRPEAVVTAVAERDYAAVASVVLTQVANWLQALLRLL